MQFSIAERISVDILNLEVKGTKSTNLPETLPRVPLCRVLNYVGHLKLGMLDLFFLFRTLMTIQAALGCSSAFAMKSLKLKLSN